jgi:hypothetical protein
LLNNQRLSQDTVNRVTENIYPLLHSTELSILSLNIARWNQRSSLWISKIVVNRLSFCLTYLPYDVEQAVPLLDDNNPLQSTQPQPMAPMSTLTSPPRSPPVSSVASLGKMIAADAIARVAVLSPESTADCLSLLENGPTLHLRDNDYWRHRSRNQVVLINQFRSYTGGGDTGC